jgi:aspartate dehydrogenase
MCERQRSVALAGLGAIGLEVARRLDRGVEGLRLVCAADRDPVRARTKLAGLAAPPEVVDIAGLAAADIVVEAMPAAMFGQVADAAVEAGRVLVPCSVGALLRRMDLVGRARETGARIVVPSGAILGLDGVRAAAEDRVARVMIETRKPPRGLAGAPYLERNGIDVAAITAARVVFEGNALEGAEGFPANVNVAAALALAGIGPERTVLRIWADPAVTRNTHTITVEAEAARFTVAIEGVPDPDNPRTGRLTPLSVIACLRGLVSTLKVGS